MIDDQHETTESAPESVVPPPPSSYGWHFWRWPRVSQFVIGMPISKEEMSLVVTMLDFTNNSVAENTKTRYGINFGTTKVSLSVPARLHYAIDLSGDRPVAFEVDGVNNIFTAVFLDPEIQAVEIFTKDRSEVIEVGCGRSRASVCAKRWRRIFTTKLVLSARRRIRSRTFAMRLAWSSRTSSRRIWTAAAIVPLPPSLNRLASIRSTRNWISKN
jgi:hypothetical protein